MTPACRRGDLDVVRLLVEDGRVQWNSKRGGAHECSGFLAAVRARRTDVVRFLLLQEKTRPQELDNLAIRLAARHGSDEIVQMLLRDPRVDPTDQDQSALVNAVQGDQLSTVRLLLEDPRVHLPVADIETYEATEDIISVLCRFPRIALKYPRRDVTYLGSVRDALLYCRHKTTLEERTERLVHNMMHTEKRMRRAIGPEMSARIKQYFF